MNEDISPELKSLLDSLLCINPSERISLEKIKLHPWLHQTDLNKKMS